MSKSSELDKTAKLYLLDAMRSHLDECDKLSAWAYPPQGKNAYGLPPKEIIEIIKDDFYSSHTWAIDRYGLQRALTEWLQGLALPIDYTYHNIIELAKEWGSIPQNATSKQEDKICDNYWSFMANKLSQLFDGYRVPKEAV